MKPLYNNKDLIACGARLMTELLRVYRVAKILDVTKKRVYNLIQEGKLEAIKLGPRQTRITRQSLEDYVEQLKKQRRIELGLNELDS